ncbi:hypothetical protein BO94DRAFT_628928 [Aspergillus sclerotioniger CBS 115572]|uniref:Zn(2)-C6 fungal-type domain-containing protein n=1 Tax=Aspergillus sclerotioniger CBS 115572 TaxID=1450535 RepID=A0A317V2Q4_9EURO|nr:hypothetical protein BO94DRAFT_628928 [Aspergillus sclerotioniger CBS 115572]PWY67072.1 hypothetical protein BO94DRAFT_628928 [Aspergillus sclerotioniger CBS 115572]
MGDQRPRRRQAQKKRSKTGCRTCRIRRIKCDETPGGCRNCQTSGWPCEGVELNPLPGKHVASKAQLLPSLATDFAWTGTRTMTMTSDEKRCLSFFHYVVLPGCVEASDPGLWEQVIFPLSAIEPAVYHAVLAFSAVNHHIHETDRLAIPGQDLRSSWHGFALVHSSQSFSLLQRRTGSHDPQLPQVLLVCCLLFILLELACARYDDANTHLRSGLHILHELRRGASSMDPAAYPIPPGLLEAFLYLDAHSAFHGVQQPFLPLDQQFQYHESFEARLCATPFQTVQQARQILHSVVPTVFLLLERCWSLTDVELLNQYPVLQPQQQRLLSCLNQFGVQWEMFIRQTLPETQDQTSTMVQLAHRTFTLALKTCLHPPCHPDLRALLHEYENLLSDARTALTRTEPVHQRPGRLPRRVARFTPDGTVCAALSFLALRCPDYAIRARAIQALRSTPRAGGYYNGALVAEYAISGLKLELGLGGGGSGSIKQHPQPEKGVWHAGQSPPGTGLKDSRDLQELLALEQDGRLLGSIASLQGASDWLASRPGGVVETKCSEIEGRSVWYLDCA